MLPTKVPWNLQAVFLVYLVRIAAGLLFVRAVYPLLFGQSSPFLVEFFDRVVMVGLVWFVVRKHRRSLESFGLSTRKLGRNIAVGMMAGGLLLGVSMYSERLYATTLFDTPVQHPLVAQVEQALSWQDLLIPLILAGMAAPVAEEVLYRLFTFLPLKQRLGLWGGAIASAVIFALLHFNAYWLAETIIVGTGLALVYAWTGSLVSSIVAHSLINTSKIIILFLGLPIV